jgi:hypothetical protein
VMPEKKGKSKLFGDSAIPRKGFSVSTSEGARSKTTAPDTGPSQNLH